MTERNDAVLLRHLAAAIDGLADTVQLLAEINTVDAIDPNVQSGLTHVHHLVSVARSHIEAARSPAPEGGETEKLAGRTWVACPICGEPGMKRTAGTDGAALIHCTNHGCRSNGGNCDWLLSPQPDHTELLREAVQVIEQMRVRLHPCDNLLPSESATLAKLQEELGDG